MPPGNLPPLLFSCARTAGNQGVTNDNGFRRTYPAALNLPNMISVASLAQDGTLNSWSNFGTTVQIAAPGENILSLLPGNYVGYLSGTSMACGFVSGAVALMKAASTYDLTPAVIRQLMMESAERIPALSGRVASGGVLDVAAAVAAAQAWRPATVPPPGAPVPPSPRPAARRPWWSPFSAGSLRALRVPVIVEGAPLGRLSLPLAINQELPMHVLLRSRGAQYIAH